MAGSLHDVFLVARIVTSQSDRRSHIKAACSWCICHPASFFLNQRQQRQQDVDVMWQHQEGQHLVGEEALHSDAEPGSSARQCLPQHEAGLL